MAENLLTLRYIMVYPTILGTYSTRERARRKHGENQMVTATGNMRVRVGFSLVFMFDHEIVQRMVYVS